MINEVERVHLCVYYKSNGVKESRQTVAFPWTLLPSFGQFGEHREGFNMYILKILRTDSLS